MSAAPLAEEDPATGESWWGQLHGLDVIFGVAFSFAAFFESFAAEFKASSAELSLVFGLSEPLYFMLGAFGGMLADRFGPRRATSAGMLCIATALGLCSAATPMVQLTLVYSVGLWLGIALVHARHRLRATLVRAAARPGCRHLHGGQCCRNLLRAACWRRWRLRSGNSAARCGPWPQAW